MREEILKFEVKGDISVWKYVDGTKNHEGWHIYVSSEARESIIQLLKLLKKVKYASKKAIYLSPPKEEIIGVPNNFYGLAPYRYKRILFLNSKKDWDTFAINENEMIVEILLDNKTISKFTKAIETNFKGKKTFLNDKKDKDQWLTFW